MTPLQSQIVDARAAFTIALGTRDERAAWVRMRELQLVEAREFAARREWRLSKRPIALEQLKASSWIKTRPRCDHPEWDHVESFVDGPQARPRIAGVRSHAYASPEMLAAFAELHGLRSEILTFSSYLPGSTVAVVFTRKSLI
jgi:hypothetical protein